MDGKRNVVAVVPGVDPAPAAGSGTGDQAPDDGAAADIRAGARVLRAEAEALVGLSETLDHGFARALDLLLAAPGRVVVTGIGKSGHVARKVAATLASTGTPAQFVHPSEASHGDLGMVTRDDAIIAFSNSGSTAELSHIVGYAKRFAIPLIGVTAHPRSPLAEQADVVLRLAPAPEACPLGLAPTTSTTQMVALGDAIAVALLNRRGFTREDFTLFHPGGDLGQRLVKVSELMHTGEEIPTVAADLPMSKTLLVMTTKRFGCVGILDRAGKLEGIITDGDLRRHMTEGLLALSAGHVMTPGPLTIRPNALAGEALGRMNENAVTSLFVVDGDGPPIGIIHVHDCLRAGIT